MVTDTSAVFAARVTEVLLPRLLQTLLEGFGGFAIRFRRWSDILALVVVDVPSYFEIEIGLAGGGYAVGASVLFTGCDGAIRRRLMGLQSTGSVCCDSEMASERRTNVGRAGVGVNLIVKLACNCRLN